ncbi:alpha/beta fold hydrolase [Shimia sagamensis]|uniref:Pimeloyl-ACP methyl ester carboxylesterase n=1 Tax=Shimia sagamensis TaxID=1566352 RepID=A0ABY1NSW9_9RHOB|nr:alpha/beta fold hydrolase [Shimia sagamensis]SMP16171.1 Pimeloyl-ACP methyl ester carboxylesterase [Shimia sagamensis]
MIPLVLLPGMMCDARLFGPQINALSGRIPIMTAPLSGQNTIEKLAAEVLRHAPPKFALAGLSMGGIVAMEMIRQAQDRVVGVALLDTNPLAETETTKDRRALQIAATLAGDMRRVLREEMKPNYLADGPNHGAILDLCMAMATDLGPEVFVRQSKALRDRKDQTETLRHYNGETLILCGREDTLCPIERHRLMQNLITGSSMQIVEQAGHLPTLEQPKITTAALTRWLEAL